MKFYSWNINGYNTCNKYGGLSKIINDNPDFVCLQEVKVANPDLSSIKGYFCYCNFSKHKGQSGVCIFSKKLPLKVSYSIGHKIFDEEGRFVCLEFEKFYLINVYMPHGGRGKERLEYKLQAYDTLLNFIQNKKDKRIILAGDFNIAHDDLDVERYKNNKNNVMFTENEKIKLTNLIEKGMVDTFRYLHKDCREYTWWPYAFNAKERNIGWRLDYFFVSNEMRKYIKSTTMLKEIDGSDHCPIKLQLLISTLDK